MHIIDDLTQADELCVGVNSQIKEVHASFTTNYCVVVAAPSNWGKSTVIEGVLSKWERNPSNKTLLVGAEFMLCNFNDVLFISDVTAVWVKFLNRLFDFLPNALKNDLSYSFPTILTASIEDDFSQDLTKISLLELSNCTVALFQKAAISLPMVISGLHKLASLKQDWPFLIEALNRLINPKNGLKVIMETQNEVAVEKFLAATNHAKDIIWHYVELPTAEKWLKSLTKFFKKKGMKVHKEVLMHLIAQLQNHPVYIKEAVNKMVVASKSKAKGADIDEIIKQMISDYTSFLGLFERTLSAVQISYLCAIARNEARIYAKDQLISYQLGTSANVAKMKRTFIEREILINRKERLQFIDPMLSLFFANKPLPSFAH